MVACSKKNIGLLVLLGLNLASGLVCAKATPYLTMPPEEITKYKQNIKQAQAHAIKEMLNEEGAQGAGDKIPDFLATEDLTVQREFSISQQGGISAKDLGFSLGWNTFHSQSLSYETKTKFALADISGQSGEIPIRQGVDGKRYPVLGSGRHLRGYCLYEVNYKTVSKSELEQKLGINLDGRFSFLGVSFGSEEKISQSVSDEFQIQRQKTSHGFEINAKNANSFEYFLNEYCEAAYAREVRGEVEKEIQGLYLSMMEWIEQVHSQVRFGKCNPPDMQVVLRFADQDDESCALWHEANGPRHGRQLAKALARCELTDNGQYQCRLHSSLGGQCKMYYNSQSKTYSENVFESHTIAATNNEYAYTCDAFSGLSCKQESEPIVVLGQPLIMGSGRCRRALESK